MSFSALTLASNLLGKAIDAGADGLGKAYVPPTSISPYFASGPFVVGSDGAKVSSEPNSGYAAGMPAASATAQGSTLPYLALGLAIAAGLFIVLR